MLTPTELALIFLVVLVLFGASRIPRLARSLGQMRAEFRKGINEGSEPKPSEEEDPEAGD